jgi:hypothetical protein
MQYGQNFGEADGRQRCGDAQGMKDMVLQVHCCSFSSQSPSEFNQKMTSRDRERFRLKFSSGSEEPSILFLTFSIATRNI